MSVRKYHYSVITHNCAVLNPEDGTDRLSRNVGKKLLFCVITQKSVVLNPEDGTDRLSRNVGKKLLLCNNPEERSSKP